MGSDVVMGMLIGLAATCMGGLFVLLSMYWLGIRDERGGPPGRGFSDPEPGPIPEPTLWEVPDHVPDEWVLDAA